MDIRDEVAACRLYLLSITRLTRKAHGMPTLDEAACHGKDWGEIATSFPIDKEQSFWSYHHYSFLSKRASIIS
jgi:hypothetical protein